MSDEPKKRSRRWIWWVVALLLLYPLSMPPVSIMATRLGCAQIVEPMYAPLIWLCGACQPFDRTLWWYAGKWTWLKGR
jgi:hypothetical protein